jgi:FtsZ-interacting cell division protein ZipA
MAIEVPRDGIHTCKFLLPLYHYIILHGFYFIHMLTRSIFLLLQPSGRKLVTKKISSRRLKRTEDMPPGGKRVRCTPPNETPAEDVPLGAKKAKTVSFALAPSSERPPGVTTRSSTRQPPPENSAQDQQATRQQPIQKSAQAQQATRQQPIQASAQDQQATRQQPIQASAQDQQPTRQQPIQASAQDQQEEDGVHSPRSYDWSYQGDYDNDDLVGEEEEHHEEQAQTGREGKCHLHLNSVIYLHLHKF